MLSKRQLQSSVNQIKAYLAFMTKSDLRLVLNEVEKQVFKGKTSLPKNMRHSISKFDTDPELHEFLLSLPMERMTQSDCIKKCVEQFGEKRVPKRNAMSYHWPKLMQQRKEKYGKQ